MIDWKRKIQRLAKLAILNPLAAKKYAEQVLILVQFEEKQRDLYIEWWKNQGTKDEQQQAHEDYIEAIRQQNNYSERMDQNGKEIEGELSG